MLYYQKGCCGIDVLLRFAGTSWPYGVLPGLLSAILGYCLGEIKDLDLVVRDKKEFIDNPYPFQLFAYLVGFVIVFRTNFAYQRYWEGIDAVQRMGAKWLDGACMAVAFDAPGDVSTPFLGASIKPAAVWHGDGPLADSQPKDADFKAVGTASSSESSQMISHRQFFRETCHLFSLLHALSLQHLRCDSDLDNLECITGPDGPSNDDSSFRMTQLVIDRPKSSSDVINESQGGNGSAWRQWLQGGQANVEQMHQLLKLSLLGPLASTERVVLESDSHGSPINTVARVTMVEGWIMRRLLGRQKHEPAADMGKTSPPILSRLYQVISDGHLAFSQACKTAETPFPFPYQNLIRVFLWLFLLTVPFVINAKILHVPARFVLNFITVGAYFALAQVGDNLEDPFMPYDPNELPLVAIQHQYNAKLLSLGIVPHRRVHGGGKEDD